MYATDKGLDELIERRGDEEVSYAALADAMREFVDLHPDMEVPIERLAIFLARDDTDED